jgi:cellulose synthase/poly-beta-1,6-N-acetylglucosamine synthase-like glycosyltransferase
MSTLAWILVALPVVVAFYAYVGYPIGLWMVAGAAKEGKRLDPGHLPTVSIVIPAYNEERQIRGAIEALLAQDYPAASRQILILSDASTDRTDEIVGEYASRGVELLRMKTRSGKTVAENASCDQLRGGIVVNSDASIRFYPQTVRRLVEAMADPNVGVASGRDVSIAPSDARTNATEAGYVGYEMWLRSLETRAGGIIGASGSGYAIRAALHKIPIKSDLSRDFSAALTARRHGYRAVSVDTALCAVPRTVSVRQEYRRKVRTISRGIETLYHNRQLLDPIQYGSFAWKLFSHKVTRWLLPITAVLGLVGVAILARSTWWAGAVLGAIAAGGAAAAVGVLWPVKRPMPRIISIAAFGCAANVAVLNAVWRFIVGHEDHIWEPTRRPDPAAGNSGP